MIHGNRNSDPLWYKDAVIYQVHVKSFFDHNDDGVGDFAGLIDKLDYISELGVTAIWLLPFYPSPMRDDGYDIADYRNINPAYGSQRDFRAFIQATHRRGLRVITELVVNHTSDQHPWFQAARHARPGSVRRNFYVWSDTDQKFPETRIIFTDTEESNWAWDPVAQQYYWHRFFSHQPDLNHNNPRVVEAVIRVMRYWFSMGVDGMRLDAIPYLCVREGTSNENLPETHEVIRQIRAAVDREFPDRMLLAEANQWPEDVRDYFGAGDECHMAYHFPLMPRMYMAIAQEDRHPITEIMEQTPNIPDNCQWVVFLRNHDELTLEMVTDRERDYMYSAYAADPRMRVNVGIRRRLAPLMDNDRGKIQLMNSLLLSLTGSPIVYYGDELGMGDNVFLGDRSGVRTPMQWSPDRNGGFSKADPQSLYLPPIMDPVYGYEAVNVEAQKRASTSLLNWTKRILNVRKAHAVFGRGNLRFLRPGNRMILAYLRSYQGDVILCVANLARSAQPVELDLSAFRGRVPVELLGRTPFPPIGELPYLLTLPGHGFYWFELTEGAEVPQWHDEYPGHRELSWLVLFAGLDSFTPADGEIARGPLAQRLAEQLETDVLPAYVGNQRWFAAKQASIGRVRLQGAGIWRTPRNEWLLATAAVEFEPDGDPPQHYFLPLALAWEPETAARSPGALTLARVRQHARTGVIHEALADERFCHDLLDALGSEQSVPWNEGELRFRTTSSFERLAPADMGQAAVHRPPSEGSNTTLLVGDSLFVKAYRRLREGVNPEWEMGRYLTEEAPCGCIAEAAGTVEYHDATGRVMTLLLVQAAARNQGDGWSYTLQYLDRYLEDACARSPADPADHDDHAGFLDLIRKLARRTADMHRALARDTDDPAFSPEPFTPADLAAWRGRIGTEARHTLALLAERRDQLTAGVRPLVDGLLARPDAIDALIESLAPGEAVASRTRYHGDYHLGQVLITDNDFVITDLEGEPGRSFEERRRKDTALKDIAGMLRSFAYARGYAAQKVERERPSDRDQAMGLLARWLGQSREAYLDAYRQAMHGCSIYPRASDEADRLIGLASLEKLLYEVRYELNSRPLWLRVPLEDLTAQLGPDHAALV